jgi:predicted phosphodiesterase
MMRIKVASDLHLEFSDVFLPNNENADVLVLAGDILVADDLHRHPIVPENCKLGPRQEAANRYRQFLARVSRDYPQVVYVAGNHEFYNGKWHATLDYLQHECNKYPNINFLEGQSCKIQNVTFVGGTLWTNINKGDPYAIYQLKNSINDFKQIRNDRRHYSVLDPVDTIIRHTSTLESFQNIIATVRSATEPTSPIVVVTHHTPSSLSINAKYNVNDPNNYAYYSDLSEFILDHPEIAVWCCGHTHHAHQYYIGETRVVCNPRGYASSRHNAENSNWNQQLIVEV